MRFQCNGKIYDTDELIVLETGAPRIPFIYMPQDHSCVMIGTIDLYKGFTIHQADDSEIRGLAARFNLDVLRGALTTSKSDDPPRHLGMDRDGSPGK